MNSFYSYTISELEDLFINLGYKKFNASQVYDWVYKKLELNFSNMSNISKDLRAYLESNLSLDLPKIIVKEESSDSTIKYLFEFEDLSKVEGVLMHHPYGTSFCISSQVGCNMGCKFCASGKYGKVRDLQTWEMVSEVLAVANDLKDDDLRLSHVVIMGIGIYNADSRLIGEASLFACVQCGYWSALELKKKSAKKVEKNEVVA